VAHGQRVARHTASTTCSPLEILVTLKINPVEQEHVAEQTAGGISGGKE
jgi:hypothetical protein